MQAWSGLGPGLRETKQWDEWLKVADFPVGDVVVDVRNIPALTRRRLGHLAKMAVSVADTALQHAKQQDIPVVWASRYGDAEKSLMLLRTRIQGDEALSPTAFGLSVHNGVGAQHSILRGMQANAICVASSDCAPEAAVVEAVGLLHEGATQVLCVVYDLPLPEPYSQFHDEPAIEIAWAALLTLPQPGQVRFELEAVQPAPDVNICSQKSLKRLPHGLEVLRFLIDDTRANLCHRHPAGRWMWRRVHA